MLKTKLHRCKFTRQDSKADHIAEEAAEQTSEEIEQILLKMSRNSMRCNDSAKNARILADKDMKSLVHLLHEMDQAVAVALQIKLTLSMPPDGHTTDAHFPRMSN